ncbi:MAG: competence/damage-inducible protein A [Myxococcota bacterium]
MTRAAGWVVTIGDELLRGEIVDSNKAFLSERLLRLDLETERHLTVPDEAGAIEEALGEAARRARVVLVSGGLGPTRDDITTEVAARTFGRKLIRNAQILEGIRGFFRSIGREMSENNAKQADFPEGAEPLPNPIGTAPGFMLEAEGARLFFMPGVPRELYRMVDEQVLPRIAAGLDRSGVVRATILRTFGIGESTLDRELDDVARDDPDVTLGFRTQFPDNLLRVVARAPTAGEASRKLANVVGEIRTRLGPIVLGEGERPLKMIVGELLIEEEKTIAVAESCTGGLLAGALTDTPGSSAYLLEGIVAYSDTAKMRDLGVPAELIEEHGAVSEEVAALMAQGIRERSGADIGISTTGIAGPGGGTTDKPVGTVVIGLSDAEGTVARRYQLMTDRVRNRELTVHAALDWIRRRILGLEIPGETFPRGKLPGRESA